MGVWLDYYAFGGRWSNDGAAANSRYLFNGKELQTTGGLGLLDYGARMYDPVLGRWFTTDPANQFANPYLFTGNSPMTYIDPDGEFVITSMLIAAGIGAAISALSYTVAVAVSDGGFDNWNWHQFGVGLAVGAIGGAVGAGVGAVLPVIGGLGGFASGAITGGITGAATGVVTNGVSNVLNGQNFWNNAGRSALIGGISGAIGGGLIQGIAAHKAGANFWNGRIELDLSNGFGATGPVPGDKTITGVYRGKFENANVFEYGDGSTGRWGITLPDRGIVVSKGLYGKAMAEVSRDLALLQHEYGHWLQHDIIGSNAYYGIVGTGSLTSAATSSMEVHASRWYEKWANFLAQEYFGGMYKGSLFPNQYPVQNISSGLLRFLLMFGGK